MKRQYNIKDIDKLLDKFMAGQTSLGEEHTLADYFRNNDVGDEWKEYKEMFALFDNGEVDSTLVNETPVLSCNEETQKTKIIPLRWFMTGIAASIIILLGIVFTRNDYSKQTTETSLAQETSSKQSLLKVTHPEEQEIVDDTKTSSIARHKATVVEKIEQSCSKEETDQEEADETPEEVSIEIKYIQRLLEKADMAFMHTTPHCTMDINATCPNNADEEETKSKTYIII